MLGVRNANFNNHATDLTALTVYLLSWSKLSIIRSRGLLTSKLALTSE